MRLISTILLYRRHPYPSYQTYGSRTDYECVNLEYVCEVVTKINFISKFEHRNSSIDYFQISKA